MIQADRVHSTQPKNTSAPRPQQATAGHGWALSAPGPKTRPSPRAGATGLLKPSRRGLSPGIDRRHDARHRRARKLVRTFEEGSLSGELTVPIASSNKSERLLTDCN